MLEDFKNNGVLSEIIRRITDIEKFVRGHSALFDIHSVGAIGGWNEVSDTWTRASANTFNVPTGAASFYKKGMGVRWKENGTGNYKYGYITVVADTLVTVTAGTDYTISVSTITNIAYTLTPLTAIGFPVKFTCAAPTWNTATIDNGTGGVQPTAGTTSFIVRGNKIELTLSLGAAGVVKNGAGNVITVSTIPATLPAIVAPIAGVIGHGLFATKTSVAVVYYISSTSFQIFSTNAIADNANIAYTNFKIEWEY